MRIAGYIISTILAVFAAVSCLVENDMSYPHVYAEVTAFAVDGQVSADIDPDTRTISVVLSGLVTIICPSIGIDFTFLGMSHRSFHIILYFIFHIFIMP